MNTHFELIPFMPNDVTVQVIKKLEDSHIRLLARVSRAFRTYIEENEKELCSPALVERLRTYRHILEVFVSIDMYKQLPVFDPHESLRSELKQAYSTEEYGPLMYMNRIPHLFFRQPSNDKLPLEFVLYFERREWTSVGKSGTYTKKYELAKEEDIKALKHLASLQQIS